MNQLIKKFEQQSGLEIFSLGLPRSKWEYCLQQFSKMIIKKCIRVVAAQRNPANLNYKPSERFVEALEQHFGIKNENA